MQNFAANSINTKKLQKRPAVFHTKNRSILSRLSCLQTLNLISFLISFLILIANSTQTRAAATSSPNTQTPHQIPQNAATEQNQPNIIFFLVDDLGWRDLTCYGSDVYETPNIDKLADQGMSFENAYAAYPRCVPSRTAIFSGKYPNRIRSEKQSASGEDRKAFKHALPLKEISFAEVLKKSGYNTCYIGKWHLGKKGGEPDKQGFDVTVHTGAAGAPGSYFHPFPTEKNKFVDNPVQGKEGDYLNDLLTDKAIDFIENNKDNKFLLVMAHYAVHTPLEAKEEDIKKYNKKIKDMGMNIGGKSGKEKDDDIVKDRQGESKSKQNNPTYAAMIENLDTNYGRLAQKLNELNIANNTVIIFTSDHGGLSTRGVGKGRPLATSNLPLRQGKGSIFEGGSRVPLIVKWPGKIAAGTKSKTQVTGTDHFPTILELTGNKLMPEQHKDGVSYLKALQGEDLQRKGMFWYKYMARPHSTGDTRAIAYVEGKYKVIQWLDEDLVELYDLDSDIGEQNNIAEQFPEKTKELLDKLLAIEAEQGNLRDQGKDY